MAYKKPKFTRTGIDYNKSTDAETIEQQVERLFTNGENVEGGKEIIYTERKDGVMPAYDIRTDRWDIAIETMDKVHASHQARRESAIKAREEKEKVGETESAGDTE